MISAKDLLVSAMLELSRNNSIRKITIAGLCREAGISKQSFYNHFKDKFDLIAWIFMSDLDSARESGEGGLSEQILTRELEAIWTKREFYKEALAEDVQNSLTSYIRAYTFDYNKTLMEKYLRTDDLSEEQKTLIRYHSDGCIGIFQAWLYGEIKMKPEELASVEYRCTPDVLKAAWDEKEEQDI